MKYFGTSLTDHGHYIWKLDGERMTKEGINLSDYPFDFYKPLTPMPEQYKGDVLFLYSNGFSICRIEGSCKDNRRGTVSVFFIEENLSNAKLKEKILSIPIASRIINQMDFDVDW